MVARLVRDQEARSSNLRTPTKRTAEGFPPLPYFSSDERSLVCGPLVEPSAAWFGKSGFALPGADEAKTLFPQPRRFAGRGFTPRHANGTRGKAGRSQEARSSNLRTPTTSEFTPHGSKTAIAKAVAVFSSVLRGSFFQNRTRCAGLRFCFLGARSIFRLAARWGGPEYSPCSVKRADKPAGNPAGLYAYCSFSSSAMRAL